MTSPDPCVCTRCDMFVYVVTRGAKHITHHTYLDHSIIHYVFIKYTYCFIRVRIISLFESFRNGPALSAIPADVLCWIEPRHRAMVGAPSRLTTGHARLNTHQDHQAAPHCTAHSSTHGRPARLAKVVRATSHIACHTGCMHIVGFASPRDMVRAEHNVT